MTDTAGGNAEKMTMAERLSLKIRESPLGELIDGDDLDKISKDALERAFFQPVLIPPTNSYSQPTKGDPLIVTLARQVFKAELEAVAKKAVAELAAMPEFRTAIAEAAIAILPDIMMNHARQVAYTGSARGADAAVESVQNALRVRLNDPSLYIPSIPPIPPTI